MWQNYLSWSASERLGILALIILTLTCAIIDRTLPVWVSNRAIARFEAMEREHFANLEARQRHELPLSDSAARPDDRSQPGVVVARPATAGISSPATGKYQAKSQPTATGPFRLNTCPVERLLASGLIERKFCYRIVRFREQSGGFYDVGQVRDIYEMTDSLYRVIAPHLVLDTVTIQPINVNGATSEALATHPYISPGLARQIVGFREKVRPFETRDDLLQLYFMDEELLAKLEPYVAYQ